MCGILGTIPESTNHDFFVKSLNLLTHRGPDDFGVFHTSEISLGHRRLSILDLTRDGQQPMHYDTELSLVFNGEIYNFLEIRKELELKGHTFKTDTDSEVVLVAYKEWGPNCLRKFNGMWAIAIWHHEKKELFLSRDRFGKKPLFYHQRSNQFVFASEMKAICPFMDNVSPSSNFHWMRDNFFQYEATEHCLIEGIKRFPAGSYGFLREGKLSISRYWNTLDEITPNTNSYEEQIIEFREIFFNACKIRMRADVSIGTALSGGLDSSAIISTMAHISKDQPEGRSSKDWQHAFVASFKGTGLDESYYAQKVVDHIGIPATFLEIDPTESLTQLEDYFFKFEELYVTNPIPMIKTYQNIKDAGVSVSIDGHGADELLSGYGASLLIAIPEAGFNLSKGYQIIDTYQNLVGSKEYKYEKLNSKTLIYGRSILKHFAKKHLGLGYHSPKEGQKSFDSLGSFNQHLYSQSHELVLPTLLRNYDRYSMMNSVEVRMPFMDHNVVTFLLSLPWSSKIRNGYTKAILRDAIAPYMPKDVAFRKTKIGFGSPINDWMRGPMKEYLLDTIESRNFKECSLLNNGKVYDQIKSVINSPSATFFEAESAWNALVPFIWEQAMIKRSYPH